MRAKLYAFFFWVSAAACIADVFIIFTFKGLNMMKAAVYMMYFMIVKLAWMAWVAWKDPR